MGAALALLPVVLQAIPSVEVGVESLVAWVKGLRSAAKQTGEWTSEQESAFLESLMARAEARAWQPDAAVKGTA